MKGFKQKLKSYSILTSQLGLFVYLLLILNYQEAISYEEYIDGRFYELVCLFEVLFLAISTPYIIWRCIIQTKPTRGLIGVQLSVVSLLLLMIELLPILAIIYAMALIAVSVVATKLFLLDEELHLKVMRDVNTRFSKHMPKHKIRAISRLLILMLVVCGVFIIISYGDIDRPGYKGGLGLVGLMNYGLGAVIVFYFYKPEYLVKYKMKNQINVALLTKILHFITILLIIFLMFIDYTPLIDLLNLVINGYTST